MNNLLTDVLYGWHAVNQDMGLGFGGGDDDGGVLGGSQPQAQPQGVGAGQQQVQAPPQQPKGGFFRNLLMGALQGVSAAVTTPQSGNGFANSAAAAMAAPEQRHELGVKHQQEQQQLNMGDAQLAMAHNSIMEGTLRIMGMSRDLQNKYFDSGAKLSDTLIQNGAQQLAQGSRDAMQAKWSELSKTVQPGQMLSYMVMPNPGHDPDDKNDPNAYTLLKVVPKGTLESDFKETLPDGTEITVPAGTSQSAALHYALGMATNVAKKQQAEEANKTKVDIADASNKTKMAVTQLTTDASIKRAWIEASSREAVAAARVAKSSIDPTLARLGKQYEDALNKAAVLKQKAGGLSAKLQDALGGDSGDAVRQSLSAVSVAKQQLDQYQQEHPQATSGQPQAGGQQNRVKVRLADGRTGTVDAKEFDPNSMQKVQ